MREIKFRGKGIHSDEWCFGNLVNYGDGECEIQGCSTKVKISGKR